LGDDLIKVGHDLDGKLRLDTTTADKIVERICERSADAMRIILSARVCNHHTNVDCAYLALRYIS
jgi:hypothetical protein